MTDREHILAELKQMADMLAMERDGLAGALADLYCRLGVEDADVALVDEVASRWYERLVVVETVGRVLLG